jgi:hypothetical protein
VRRAGLEPDCAPIADKAKNTAPVNSMEEILSTSDLVPEDPQITAAVDTISIAASSNIEGKKTVLTSNEYLANYWYSRQCTEKDNISTKNSERVGGEQYVERLGMRRVYDNGES